MSAPFPFSAIVGQNEMREALLMAAVEPSLGGVLVFGHRGTGKSTAVRALAGLLPKLDAFAGCKFNCDPDAEAGLCDHCARLQKSGEAKRKKVPTPVIDLPLGASEDRVVGSLDLEKALVSGEKSFEPGLLAAANRGFLYIDEANLLEDHLVDLLLDVAASGVNVVEREGLSVRHAAKFVLVGSGNPEEGELRPQLLDRFGLSVEVTSPTKVADRVEVVKRRDSFDRDPDGFAKKYRSKESKVRTQIAKAKVAVADLSVPDDTLADAATLCMALGVDGLRGELTLIRAARARAALDGDKAVARSHLLSVVPSALRHRLRRDPLDEAGSTARIERAIADLTS